MACQGCQMRRQAIGRWVSGLLRRREAVNRGLQDFIEIENVEFGEGQHPHVTIRVGGLDTPLTRLAFDVPLDDSGQPPTPDALIRHIFDQVPTQAWSYARNKDGCTGWRWARLKYLIGAQINRSELEPVAGER